MNYETVTRDLNLIKNYKGCDVIKKAVFKCLVTEPLCISQF